MNPKERLHWEKHYKRNLQQKVLEINKESIFSDYDNLEEDNLEKSINLYIRQNNQIVFENNLINIDTIKPVWGEGELHLCECESCFPSYKTDVCDCSLCNGSLYEEKIILQHYIEPCNYSICTENCITCNKDIYIYGFRTNCIVNSIKTLLFQVENEKNRDEKIKLSGEIFKLLSNKDGQYLLNTQYKFRIVVKHKLEEFYLIEGEKIAYKWYRDVFKERLKI